MRRVLWIVPLIAGLAPAWQGPEEQAVRKVLTAFNDLKERPKLLTPDADVAPLTQYGAREVSQVYFEAQSVKFVTPDVVFVDAKASQYGSTIMKRSMPAYFVLKKVEGVWRVAVMRIGRRPAALY
jgi:hypothetical protein